MIYKSNSITPPRFDRIYEKNSQILIAFPKLESYISKNRYYIDIVVEEIPLK